MNQARAIQFIEDCWKIVRTLGREERQAANVAQLAWGLNPDGALVYKDKLIEIVAEREPSRAILVTQLANNNPLLCTTKAGEPFRWHGQYAQINAHVRLVAAGIDQ